MAACDALYRFTLIDLGAYGREGDRSVYATSPISKSLENGSMGLPPDVKLPNSDICLPHFFVGDEVFPLKTYLMKPYPGRKTGVLPVDVLIYNYR